MHYFVPYLPIGFFLLLTSSLKKNLDILTNQASYFNVWVFFEGAPHFLHTCLIYMHMLRSCLSQDFYEHHLNFDVKSPQDMSYYIHWRMKNSSCSSMAINVMEIPLLMIFWWPRILQLILSNQICSTHFRIWSKTWRLKVVISLSNACPGCVDLRLNHAIKKVQREDIQILAYIRFGPQLLFASVKQIYFLTVRRPQRCLMYRFHFEMNFSTFPHQNVSKLRNSL